MYDVIHVLKAWPGGPGEAGREIARSPVRSEPLAAEALADLRARFSDEANDGPSDYAVFMAVGEDDDARATYRNEAVATMDMMASGLGERTDPDAGPSITMPTGG